MKKIQHIFAQLAMIAAATAFIACEQIETPADPDQGNGGQEETEKPEEKPVVPQKHQLTVKLVLPEGVEALPAMEVTISNPEKELEYVKTFEAGTLSMDMEVPSGQYNIIAKGKASLTLSYTGAAKSDVFDKTIVEVKISEVYKSPLIFKEIYSNSFMIVGGGPVLNDTYFEIVNNSDEVQYLDQLLLSSVVVTPTNPWAEVNKKGLYNCMGVVAAFPGTGKEHALQPGQSVVVANDAKDWTKVSPDLADLSNADWEVYVADQGDEDFPKPNLNIIHNNKQRRLGMGFSSTVMILSKLPEGVTPEAFMADKSNFQTEPNKEGATEQHCMINSNWVLDLVELGNEANPTALTFALAKDDAAPVLTKAFCGKSIRRKVTKVVDGRAYYQDTNNSKEDFLNNQPLTPGVHPTVADK